MSFGPSQFQILGAINPLQLIITSIVVDLSDQKLYAYNGPQLVRTIPVSSGKASTPTPTFSSKVQSKHRSVTMRGRGYVAPGVPWAMCVPGADFDCLTV
jgi:hypothetical protein